MNLDQIKPEEEPKLPEATDVTATVKPEVRASEYLDPVSFLSRFPNGINPSAIISVEKRPDGAIVVHCNNFYEYLKFGYREDPGEVEKIEKHKTIFEALSNPDSIAAAMLLISKLPEEEKEWITGKWFAWGSAVPVEFQDGEKEAIVMMNDMPTRRLLNADGTRRNEAEIQENDKEYRKTVEHEVRHTQYYNRFGKNLEEWRKIKESLRPLTPLEERKYHYDRYLKDEVVAHIENEMTENPDGTTHVNWEGIVDNLQGYDYRDLTGVFRTEEDRTEYLTVSRTLVNRAKEAYEQNRPIDEIMNLIARIDVQQFMIQAV